MSTHDSINADPGADTDGRHRIEEAVNASLPEGQQVVFDRDGNGLIRPWGFIPVQAGGTLDGLRLYFRFRGNHAHLTVYTSADEQVAHSTAGEDEVYPDSPYAGMFESEADMVACFVRLVEAQLSLIHI